MSETLQTVVMTAPLVAIAIAAAVGPKISHWWYRRKEREGKLSKE